MHKQDRPYGLWPRPSISTHVETHRLETRSLTATGAPGLDGRPFRTNVLVAPRRQAPST
jgi:hypothetical protein